MVFLLKAGDLNLAESASPFDPGSSPLAPQSTIGDLLVSRRISGPKQETSPTAAIVRHWCMLKFVKRLLKVVDWTLGELYEFVSYIAEHP